MTSYKKTNFCLLVKKVYRFFNGRPDAKDAWQKEFPDLKLIYLIRHYEKKFAVGIDKQLDLDWQTTTEFDKAELEGKAFRDYMYSEVVRLETMVGKKWPIDEQIQAKRMIGECLVQAFYGQEKESKEALSRANQYVRRKSVEVSRCLILATSLPYFGVVIITGLLLYIFRSQIGRLIGESMTFGLLCACMGGIGSFSAIVLRIRKLIIPSTASRWHHQIEALGMMTTGCIAGFTVMLLIKSGLAFSAYVDNEHFPYLVMVLAMGAGMSMRWVNLVIGQFDNVEEKPKPQADAASPKASPQGDTND